MNDHPDLEKLDASVRDIVREVFRDIANGTPDDISKAGCLALAKLGHIVWNAWRNAYEVKLEDTLSYSNITNFEGVDFTLCLVINNSFENYSFGDGANFKSANFGWGFSFKNAKFGDETNFDRVSFYSRTDFTGAIFGRNVSFKDTKFGEWCDFTAAQFDACAKFENTKNAQENAFFGSCSFKGAQFADGAEFIGVIFNGHTSFVGRSWGKLENLYLTNSNARDRADKLGLTPSTFQSITFKSCRFNGVVDFSGRTFLGATRFTGVDDVPTIFAVTPKFHGCHLHSDTSFEGAVFPKSSGAIEARNAYRVLKLAFSQQQAIREEQRFFRLEMAEEAMVAQGWKRKLYAAYSFFSDYGFSVWLPIKRLVLVPALFFLAFYYFLLAFKTTALETQALIEFPVLAVQLFQFTLTNAMPIPGIDLGKDLRTALFDANSVSGSVALLGEMIQKAMVLTAYFLAGLAIRNLFKLK